MEFEWDQEKSRLNFDKHGIDFIDAQGVFDGRLRYIDLSFRSSEVRLTITAMLGERLFTVVWTTRGTAIRLISARRARDAETRTYRQLHG